MTDNTGGVSQKTQSCAAWLTVTSYSSEQWVLEKWNIQLRQLIFIKVHFILVSSICLLSIKQAPDYVFAIIIIINYTLSYYTSIIQLPVSSSCCFPLVISWHRPFPVTMLITALCLLLKVPFNHFWPLGGRNTSYDLLPYNIVMANLLATNVNYHGLKQKYVKVQCSCYCRCFALDYGLSCLILAL